MPNYRKILFPVDYSTACQQIIPYVREMARHYQAQLILLHVLPVYIYPVSMSDALMSSAVLPVDPAARQLAEERLAAFGSHFFPGVPLQLELREGDTAQAIGNFVQEHKVDLVMLPTRGSGLLRRFLMGSVTAKLLHDLSCAVWTCVPEHLPPPDFAGYRSILCAPGTEPTERREIARFALDCAREREAELALAHVVELPFLGSTEDYIPRLEEIRAREKDGLEAIRQELDCTAKICVQIQHVPEGLRDLCQREHADLLILGRGHAKAGSGLHWSHLYATIRDAPCPVLSI